MNEVCAKLKFIASVKPEEKLNLRQFGIDKRDGLWTSVRRFVFFEGRAETLKFVQSTVSQAFGSLISTIDVGTSISMTLATNLLKDIQACGAGIANLEITYRDDVMFQAKLKVIRESIDVWVQDVLVKHAMLRGNVTEVVSQGLQNSKSKPNRNLEKGDKAQS